MSYDEVLEQVLALPDEDRIQLLHELIDTFAEKLKTHNITELDGIGAHLYDGTDAQEYVNEMRNEWDQRL
jgi:hypothetical protein